MNEKKKNNSFSLIISILTLAVMSVGTTFAFFSTVVKSEEKVKVSSANFKIVLDVSPLYTSKTIIPTNDDDITTALNNECIDDASYGACYAYNVKITSEGEAQDILGKFKITSDGIPNLKYLFLDADAKDENNNYIVYKEMASASEEYESIGEPIHLENGKSKNLILVIWLSNLDKPQNDEAAKTFQGYLTVDSTLGTKITGTLSANADNS